MCGKVATTKYACKACGSTEHLAHTHGCDRYHCSNATLKIDTRLGRKLSHVWANCDKAHEHPHDGNGHKHG